MQQELSLTEQKQLLSFARSSIIAFLEHKNLQYDMAQSTALESSSGCFVSLKVNGVLRGCIGIFGTEKTLSQGVREMAIAAATQDPRFYPVTREEMDQIVIDISVLSPLQRIESIDEIEVGTHGLYIEKNTTRGVLLPQVATEYGWDKETFLRQTAMKAGLSEDAWKENCTLYIFTAQVFGEE